MDMALLTPSGIIMVNFIGNYLCLISGRVGHPMLSLPPQKVCTRRPAGWRVAP